MNPEYYERNVPSHQPGEPEPAPVASEIVLAETSMSLAKESTTSEWTSSVLTCHQEWLKNTANSRCSSFTGEFLSKAPSDGSQQDLTNEYRIMFSLEVFNVLLTTANDSLSQNDYEG